MALAVKFYLFSKNVGLNVQKEKEKQTFSKRWIDNPNLSYTSILLHHQIWLGWIFCLKNFIQILSEKDQKQYWHCPQEHYSYVPVSEFANKFKAHHIGQRISERLSEPIHKTQSHIDALSFSIYSLPKKELFKACMARELLLMKRNSIIYIFKLTQVLKPFLDS